MAEYIEREALLKDIKESVVFTVRDGRPSAEIRGANKIIDRIKSAPATDVVEVVRCEDCKYSEPINRNISPYKYFREECVVCRCGSVVGDEPMVYLPNHFCSYGRKRG